jgi:glycosyltransferase involved in cell wall biosynthesis
MLAQSPIAGDTRILREATTLRDHGHDVVIVGRQVPEGFEPPPGIEIRSVGRAGRGGSAAARGGLVQAGARAARWVLLPEHRRRVEAAWTRAAWEVIAGERPDVVHAHDFNTLALGARLARGANASLVYDSHELWSGRPRIGRPTPVGGLVQRRRERELGAAADAVLTVGHGVAQQLRAMYGWTHVTVVRNTFPLERSQHEPPAQPTSLLYAGRLAPYRELEVIAAAAADLPLPVQLMGPADPTWLGDFDPGAATVHPPASLQAVDQALLRSGLALVTHSDRWLNHRLAMPNKLFHAVSVGVPVVATDVGQLGDIVRQHDLGTLYRPGDPEDLRRAVDRALRDYGNLRRSVLAAQRELSWETDAERLLKVYSQVGG